MVTKSMASHDATTFWLGHTHFHVTLRQKPDAFYTSNFPSAIVCAGPFMYTRESAAQTILRSPPIK